MEEKKLRDSFYNPPAEFRAKPFWAWNGKLDKEELFRQIQIIKEMGFGGFFMHSRTGLQTEYLGDEWFRLINECADEGAREGLEAWLYDEDRWPSGIAGGFVTRDKRYRARFLEMKICAPGEKVEYPGEIVAMFACEMEAGNFKELRKIKKGEDAEKRTVLIFGIAESECKDVYNGYTYADTMNKEATRKFLELTHEQYRKKCSERIGSSIRGVFTDEPHRGAMFSTFSEGDTNRVPYTEQLFSAFYEECGYDLRDRLPYLFLRDTEEPFSKTALDYIEVCQKLFLENFAQPIQNWCAQNHMIFTGHVLHEDSLSAQTAMQGSLMRFYEYMDYPGIDILTEQNNCWWVVKQVTSVARQLRKSFVLSELYGGTGWQMSLENYKQVGDWQALFGVNFRCPHLAWYTMQGEAKRDYPASIFYQSAWYREYEKLETYFARIGVFLSQGENECDLLVINPIESVWGYCRCGAFQGLEAEDKRIRFLEKRYREVFKFLVCSHIEFDYGEESILKKHGKVKENLLYVGDCCYKKVLVTGMDTIRSSTLSLLEKFRDCGGTVIFAGEIPQYVEGEHSENVKAIADKCVKVEFSRKDIVEHCRSGKEIYLEGCGEKEILCRSTSDRGIRYVMLLNSNRETEYHDIRIDFGEGARVELWNARNGKIQCFTEKSVNSGIITADFSPGEEKLYRVVDKSSAADEVAAHKASEDKMTADGVLAAKCPDCFPYALDEDNILVLDWIETEVAGCRIHDEVLKADRRIRGLLGLPERGGEMVQPWYNRKNKKQQQKMKCPISLKYIFYVKQLPSNVSLAFEDINHISGLYVNGNAVVCRKGVYWIDPCFTRVEIPDGLLKEGENEILIYYEYQMDHGLEAVYLLGKFGVFYHPDRNRWEVSQLPDYMKAGDITYQGLPFYSGKIRYDLPEVKGCCSIRNLKFLGSCIKAVGDTEEVLFAPPYCCEIRNLRALEVVLTRRNTFGPLHCADKKRFAYGPDAFVSEKDKWQNEYVLLQQGLMEKPEIYFKWRY